MGGDGGTTATQRRFIRGYKNPEDKEDAKNVKEQQRVRSQTCAYSSTRLEAPIVACELGHLYSKEKLINGLVEKALPASLSHIRGLKDVRTLQFCANPDYSKDLENDGNYIAEYICPISQLEFNGIFPFVVIWSTGFVLSEKAVREMGIDQLQTEYGPFSKNDIVKLLPCTPEEMEECRDAMNARRHEVAQKKKTNKQSKSAVIEGTTTAAINGDPHIVTNTSSSKHSGDGIGKRKHRDESTASAACDVAVGDAAATASAAVLQPAAKITKASATLKAAQEEISKQKSSSSGVFSKLFHSDNEAAKRDKDLFMTVAGIRYTLN